VRLQSRFQSLTLTRPPPHLPQTAGRDLRSQSALPAADKVDPSNVLTNKKVHPFTSTALLILLDVVFRQLFLRAKISFPSSLAGCAVLLATLLASPPSAFLYQQLQPGAALLAKWLPVFFVPSLVTLPLAAGLGSVGDLIKVGVVIVGGFFFTLLTTAGAVSLVRGAKAAVPLEGEVASVAATAPAPKAFSATLVRNLALTAATTGLVSALGLFTSKVNKYLTAACFLTTTLASFVWGARLPASFTKVVHPLVTCTTLTWTTVALLASLTGRTFRGLLRSYKTGLVWTGPGDVLLFLLGPAVVSLALSVYERRQLVRENAAAVGTAVGVSTFGGVFGTALAVRLLSIGNPAVRLALVSRNITSPLAMAIAALLGADASLAVSMVVITGLIGANFGASILTAAGVQDALARGLGMGAAAHGLGTAALASTEKDAFPFAAIAMALTASAATVTVSIPFLRRVVLQLALGW
jgi:putative effector of murein hydrolase/putative effector of murein hydrolase LrgA (UPF0299 family)